MTILKVLIVSENASNVFGGEAMLPLNYARFLAKAGHEVYLITHARVKSTIAQIAEINQDRVFYVPDTWMHQWLHRYSSIFPERIRIATFGFLMHLITQCYQWKLARQVIKAHHIDIVHEPAPVSAVQPSAMFGLGVPVVIGPMNGGMSFPPAFSDMAGNTERAFYKLMRVLSAFYNLLIPGKFLAGVLVVANERTRLALPKFRLGKVVELVENGVFSAADSPKTPSQTNGVSVLFVGRLVDWKTIDIVIDAIAMCAQNATLTILGDGPLRQQLTQYANTKAPGRVRFMGAVPHARVNQYYDDAHVFVLPSVRECGGAVVLEAMSRGLPVIATDWGGPADYITAETGFLIKPISRDYMVNAFAEAIDKLASTPELRQKIGAAAIKRVSTHFMWDEKVQDMIKIYQQAIESKK